MQTTLIVSALLIGVAVAVCAALVWGGRRDLRQTRESARLLLDEAKRDGENLRREGLVAAQERSLQIDEEVERRERELEERESALETRTRDLDRQTSTLGRDRKELERLTAEAQKLRAATEASADEAEALAGKARTHLEQIAQLTTEQARADLIAQIEDEARKEGQRIARQIEERARQEADREARNLLLQASQRVNIRDVMESTVSFIELPSDEMKGRIIGKEGRNIRALEMATGIDLIVDDTPRSIWISSFDPVRREVARVSIDRLLVDGRIHPARIEEVVQQVSGEIEQMIEDKGQEAAYALGISELHPKLARLVGKMRYHTSRGQNLLQHALEVATIANHMTHEIGGQADVALRAGLLHEIGEVADGSSANHPIFTSADLAGNYRESEAVVQAIRSLHPDVQPTTVESLLLNTANRLSDNRPGARKDNLAVFIERLRRLEEIAVGFDGVQRAYAVKAGKELRVIVDVDRTRDDSAFSLAKQIARAVERELSYPGQIKVSVIRETRAVRFAV